MNSQAPASRDDLLTLAEAVEVLGARRVDAVAWMRAAGIVHGVLRREYVIRGDLLDAIRADRPAPTVVASTAPRAAIKPRTGRTRKP